MRALLALLLLAFIAPGGAKGNQNGFYSLTGELGTALIEAVTEINLQWVERATQPVDAAGLAAYEKTLWDTWNRWSVKPHYDAATIFRNQQRQRAKGKDGK